MYDVYFNTETLKMTFTKAGLLNINEFIGYADKDAMNVIFTPYPVKHDEYIYEFSTIDDVNYYLQLLRLYPKCAQIFAEVVVENGKFVFKPVDKSQRPAFLEKHNLKVEKMDKVEKVNESIVKVDNKIDISDQKVDKDDKWQVGHIDYTLIFSKTQIPTVKYFATTETTRGNIIDEFKNLSMKVLKRYEYTESMCSFAFKNKNKLRDIINDSRLKIRNYDIYDDFYVTLIHKPEPSKDNKVKSDKSSKDYKVKNHSDKCCKIVYEHYLDIAKKWFNVDEHLVQAVLTAEKKKLTTEYLLKTKDIDLSWLVSKECQTVLPLDVVEIIKLMFDQFKVGVEKHGYTVTSKKDPEGKWLLLVKTEPSSDLIAGLMKKYL